MAERMGRRPHQSVNMPTKQQGNRIKKTKRRRMAARSTGSRGTRRSRDIVPKVNRNI
jgi:hypothetical protein